MIKLVSCMDWQWVESLLMLMQVGGFSIDHHLGGGWLCKQFRAVLGGCITTKGKTTG